MKMSPRGLSGEAQKGMRATRRPLSALDAAASRPRPRCSRWSSATSPRRSPAPRHRRRDALSSSWPRRRSCLAPSRRHVPASPSSAADHHGRPSRYLFGTIVRNKRLSAAFPAAACDRQRTHVLIHCTYLRVSLLFDSLRPARGARLFCGATSTPRPGSTLSELASVSGVGGYVISPPGTRAAPKRLPCAEGDRRRHQAIIPRATVFFSAS